jgi:hypothetical protein
MLRNSPDIFIAQSTSRKFLKTLEDVIRKPDTDNVVKERILDVVSAAAYASASSAWSCFFISFTRSSPFLFL